MSKVYKIVSNEAIQVLTGCRPLYIKASVEKETLDSIVNSKTTLDNEDFTNFAYNHRLPPRKNKMINWKFYNQEMDGANIFTDVLEGLLFGSLLSISPCGFCQNGVDFAFTNKEPANQVS
ncbi:hypothetical protein AVEN_178222-1 [Araneus ventricosus]|uniref:Uncharacterized protein n=1 Tax=Araneus ventricosus TaxID=182803 RepID=A0A4Y2U8P1_ARAVE|nr:hypothetical protein AVEN_178222-1 [Araneus ventricosus]